VSQPLRGQPTLVRKLADYDTKVWKMLVFAKGNRRSYAGKCSSDSLKPGAYTENAQPPIPASVYRKIALLPEPSKQKVLNIRQRLEKGTYDLDKYLDVSLGKVLNELRR